MLKNFIITSIRTLTRNKTYFGLGVLGLTLAISCIISLYAIINYQSNFDTHHIAGDKIYRIVGDYKFGEDQGTTQTVPHLLADGIREELPGVAEMSNIFLLSDQVNIPQSNNQIKKFQQSKIAFVQDDIFDILTFEWVTGKPNTMGPTDVFLSTSVVEKYFGITTNFQSVINKELILANKHTLQVKGIYKDFPKKTDFPFAIITSYDNQEGVNPYYTKSVWARLNGGTQCILKVTEKADAAQVEKNINLAFAKYNEVEGYTLRLQPLYSIHTDPIGNYSGISFIKEYEILSYAVAIILAIIGSINFINLSTARAIKRAKEVGIRKVMGSLRGELIAQFMMESMIIVLFALGLGFFIADFILGSFQTMVNFEISLQDISAKDWIIFCSVILSTMTVLSGLYPALIISGFSPLNAIKTKISNIDRQSKVPLRKLLVGVQFTFSIILIVCALAIFSQMKYMKSFDMGFKSDGIISMVFPKPDLEKQRRLELLLGAEPEFQATSLHLGSPIARTNNTSKYFNPLENKEEKVQMTSKGIDEKYLQLFDIKLLSGRNLSTNGPEQQVLLTEDALSRLKLGSPEEAIGKVIEADWGGKFKVQGVIESFKSQALTREQIPAILEYNPNEFYELAVTLTAKGQENTRASIKKLESIWDQVYPDLLIQYDFLDEQIKNQYQFVNIISKSTTFYVIIALTISILGLYGLTDYIANSKKKEIGIRKVVGAETRQILGLFIKEVLIILAISFIIATSTSMFFMTKWLNGFEYRIDLGWEIIATTLLSIVTVTIATMGYRSYKAATINPVTVLKDE